MNAHQDFRNMTAAALLVVLSGYGIVGRIDYEAELRAEAEAQSARAETAERIVIDCLNGNARWIDPDEGTLVACDKAWTTKL
jgi:hypothetical protein